MGDEALREAVDLSGYPLQTVVAGWLVDHGFAVCEEWAFVDADTGVRRTVDIEAARFVDGWVESDAGRVAVGGCLLIECRQSRNPYIGFEAVTVNPRARRLPLTGLPHDEVVLRWVDSSEGEVAVAVPTLDVLGLTHHPFLTDPPVAAMISKAHPKGKRVELSGEEPYNALVRPLVKAMLRYTEHWSHSAADRSGGHYSVHLPMPLAVVDAPLLLARGRKGSSDIRRADWMRVISHEAANLRPRPWRPLGFHVIDVVHADFLPSFVEHHVVPFFDELARRVHHVQDALVTGAAWRPEVSSDLARDGYFFEWLTSAT
jgi:hypothetical protein